MWRAVVLLLFLCWTLTTSLGAIPPSLPRAIYINEVPVRLTVINERVENGSNKLYFSVRDYVRYIGGEIIYSPSQNFFILKIPPITMQIHPNQKKFSLNGKNLSFKNKTLFKNGQLYVPIDEFFKNLDYEFNRHKEIAIISPIKMSLESKKELFQKIESQHILSSKKIYVASNHLNPRLFVYENKKVSAQKYSRHINNTLEVDILFLAKILGYSTKITKETLELKYKNIRIVFSLNENKIKVFVKNKQKNLFTHSSLKKDADNYFFSLQKALELFDCKTYWVPENKTLYFLNKISPISIASPISSLIKIQTRSGILNKAKLDTSLDKMKHTLDIPFSHYPMTGTQTTIDVNHEVIKKITVENINSSTRFSFFTKRPTEKFILNAVSFGGTLRVINELKKFRIVPDGKVINIFIDGTLYKKPSITKKNAKQLFIDFPYAHNNIPKFSYEKKIPHIVNISVYKLKMDIPVIRFVLHFKDPMTYQYSYKNSTLALALKVSSKQPYNLRSTPKHYSVLRGRTIIIDPGHGGRDPGAVRGSMYEKFYTLDVSFRLKKLLESKGANVILTRDKDKSISLSQRTRFSKHYPNGIFVSIHFNSHKGNKYKGSETFYYKKKDFILAKHLQKQIIKDLQRKNKGVKRSKLYVLRHTKTPAALVEALFMSSTEEGLLLQKPKYRQRIARSIYQGIINYYTYF